MIEKKYLPSKNFLTALSIAVAFIFISIIINYWKSNTTKYTNSILSDSADDISAFVNLDSDKDGMPDWKESLYGTDSKLADTDADGTNDTEEISLNRDPLKPNTAQTGQEPNDKIDPAIIEKSQKIIDEYQKLSETDKFSRNLISNIIASQPASGPMDPDTMNSILEKSLSEIPQKNYNGVTKISDLNLLKTDSTNLNENMTNYAKSFSEETGKLIPFIGADLRIIDAYTSDTDTRATSEMMKLIDSYQSIVDNLIKMPVPVAIGYYDVNYHLKIINDLEIMIAIDRDVINSDKDSLSVFSNLAIFGATAKDLYSTLATVDGILKIQR